MTLTEPLNPPTLTLDTLIMDTQPDSLTIAQLERRLAAALEANDKLADAAIRPLGALNMLEGQYHRVETELALYRADKLAERNALPSHDPRLPLLSEVVDKLGAILGVAPAPLPVAPNAVPEDTTPPAHTD